MTISYLTFMKHAEKVTKTVGNSRPILNGVYHAENGDLIVTDSHRLYVANEGHKRADKPTINPKTGLEIEGNFPDVSRLIPNKDPKMTIKMNVVNTLKASKALKACGQLEDKIIGVSLDVEETNHAQLTVNNKSIQANHKLGNLETNDKHNLHFNLQYLIDSLELFKDAGAQEVSLNTYGEISPFTLTADCLLALILPIRRTE